MDSINQIVPDSLIASFVGIVHDLAIRCDSSGGDLGIAEAALGQAIDKVRGLLVGQALERSQAACRDSFYCRSCRKEMTPWGVYKRQVVTAHGEGQLRVERLYCRSCKTQMCPMLVRNALTGTQFSLGARRAIAEEAAEFPFGRAAQRMKRCGISVSAAQVDQIAQEVAGWRKDEEEAVRASLLLNGRDLKLELHDKARWERQPADTHMVISVDGAKVRSNALDKDGQGLEWFETRVGVLTLNCDQAPKVFVAGVSQADRLFETLWSQSRQLAGKRPVVFVADGANWIWDRVTQFFPKAVQVLDIYHAAEHVASAARACWGDKSPQTSEWVATARNRLAQPEGVQGVVRELCRCLRSRQCADPKELTTQIHYLWKNRLRMRYAWLSNQGLPIGSGVMESAIKQTSTQRLRQPGMMWTRDHAALMLRLRAACLSGSLNLTLQRQALIAATNIQPYTVAA